MTFHFDSAITDDLFKTAKAAFLTTNRFKRLSLTRTFISYILNGSKKTIISITLAELSLILRDTICLSYLKRTSLIM